MYEGCKYYENMLFVDFDRTMVYPDFNKKYWGGFIESSLDKLFVIMWTGASANGRISDEDKHSFRVIINTEYTNEAKGKELERQKQYIDQIYIPNDYIVGKTNDYKRIAKLISSKSLPQFDMINDYFEYIIEDGIVSLNQKLMQINTKR